MGMSDWYISLIVGRVIPRYHCHSLLLHMRSSCYLCQTIRKFPLIGASDHLRYCPRCGVLSIDRWTNDESDHEWIIEPHLIQYHSPCSLYQKFPEWLVRTFRLESVAVLKWLNRSGEQSLNQSPPRLSHFGRQTHSKFPPFLPPHERSQKMELVRSGLRQRRWEEATRIESSDCTRDYLLLA